MSSTSVIIASQQRMPQSGALAEVLKATTAELKRAGIDYSIIFKDSNAVANGIVLEGVDALSDGRVQTIIDNVNQNFSAQGAALHPQAVTLQQANENAAPINKLFFDVSTVALSGCAADECGAFDQMAEACGAGMFNPQAGQYYDRAIQNLAAGGWTVKSR